jgi:deoxyribonuclease V
MALRLHHRHAWNVSPAAARRIQERLRKHTIQHDQLGAIRLIAGVDASYDQARQLARAAVVVFQFPSLTLLEQIVVQRALTFPYVPGLLSFRELPVVLAALRQLRHPPDLILCDGQGIAHPRRMGVATHLGILTDLPTIGVAKTRLIGEHGRVPGRKGRWAPLVDNDEVIGAVLRTRRAIKPVFVSQGHRVSLATAIAVVMKCVTCYRLAEPIRAAHRAAGLT